MTFLTCFKYFKIHLRSLRMSYRGQRSSFQNTSFPRSRYIKTAINETVLLKLILSCTVLLLDQIVTVIRLTYLVPLQQLLQSFFLSFFFFSQFATTATCLIGFRPNSVTSSIGQLATKVMGCLTSEVIQEVTGVKKVHFNRKCSD